MTSQQKSNEILYYSLTILTWTLKIVVVLDPLRKTELARYFEGIKMIS